MGAELSLISSKVLEFGRKTGMVKVEGINKRIEMVSLYKVILDCELVYGSVEIGVPSEFPRADVDILLGNDLAGGKIWSAMLPTCRPASVVAPPLASKGYLEGAVTRSLSREAAENEGSLNLASVVLAEMSLLTLCHEGLEGGKTKSIKVRGGKGEEVDLPLAKRKVLEIGNKDEKQIKLLKGPELDMDDLSGLAELFEEVESSKGVPDNEVRAVLDGKGTLASKKSAEKAEKVVSARRVAPSPGGGCPESNWEDRGKLEFEKGTGVESLEEANVPFECVRDGDARGTEPGNGAQKKSEVFDSVERGGRPCGSVRLGSVEKGVTLVTVGSVTSPVFAFEGGFKVNAEFKNGGMRIIIEGNGKSVVPKSKEEILNLADRSQSELGDSGAPHSIVMPGWEVKRPRSKCYLNEEFKLKTHILKGTDKRAGHLGKIKELGGNGLSLGHGVDKIAPMNEVGGSSPSKRTQVPHGGTRRKRGDG
ncbi:uncharacterized protein LOC132404906 [Hypanus sabinus]|uniref:uncharacterized protein LOC132404906 n=1 Tax=Hypanus sabinus TaxID=79690 RepID=UPI0028C50610|nr:uncharacterized protein LOC132404906 [Hypanus sabinus]XP_059845478.1 uncharacterized protein LOC132404906 [Hypanus sabinus]XP_059845479.1 uncharacterized protein LOC132404906 [Hypanus sabinus]XP_059845480.1 uncharacterized protein LOC132404906 [Hypanus sabinus]XP_059845481.1 uncharacterized protein LOC132404906 [Hypanus sabinus]XP_059845482.1 uncharacterized protein LOC132404906 [Hypanus sabinus]XP_059845484.1 uncharacterized protein LOC132404906 [Hypanus sabinus]XP_059845485.1 uncharacte